ncbi:IS3 family transposase [Flavobacterium daemonense]|uniref:IS3 family transposase n=1 Tax=Flavobacterium daemonense TaxID=1393049 RepID=UPI001185F1FA|nr:IS3 family transposase [Flavobacterium daemonense]KAF2333781.1 transposase [Flavobacterium daemonense]
MKKRIHYNRDFKLRAIQLSYENGSVTQTARDLQISLKSLSLWRNILKKNGSTSFPGKGNSISSSEEKKIRILKKQIRNINLKFEIIRNAREFIMHDKSLIFQFIAENEKNYPKELMCKTLGTNTVTYQAWKKGFLTKKQKCKSNLKYEINSIFVASRETYGCYRIAVELEKCGYLVSPITVLRYMRELGIYVSIKKK